MPVPPMAGIGAGMDKALSTARYLSLKENAGRAGAWGDELLTALFDEISPGSKGLDREARLFDAHTQLSTTHPRERAPRRYLVLPVLKDVELPPSIKTMMAMLQAGLPDLVILLMIVDPAQFQRDYVAERRRWVTLKHVVPLDPNARL